MPQWNRFVAAKKTYKADEGFAWALFKERETLTEAVSSLEARIAKLEGALHEALNFSPNVEGILHKALTGK